MYAEYSTHVYTGQCDVNDGTHIALTATVDTFLNVFSGLFQLLADGVAAARRCSPVCNLAAASLLRVR